MAGSVNKVILVGNLGADPEIRSLTSGDRVANLGWRPPKPGATAASGERKEKTEWHRVVVFNENIVKVCENYLRKGAKNYVEGSLQNRKWTDQSGVEKFSTEVVLQKFRGELTMLGGRGDNAGRGARAAAIAAAASPRPAPASRAPAPREEFSADLDDEIPF